MDRKTIGSQDIFLIRGASPPVPPIIFNRGLRPQPPKRKYPSKPSKLSNNYQSTVCDKMSCDPLSGDPFAAIFLLRLFVVLPLCLIIQFCFDGSVKLYFDFNKTLQNVCTHTVYIYIYIYTHTHRHIYNHTTHYHHYTGNLIIEICRIEGRDHWIYLLNWMLIGLSRHM